MPNNIISLNNYIEKGFKANSANDKEKENYFKEIDSSTFNIHVLNKSLTKTRIDFLNEIDSFKLLKRNIFTNKYKLKRISYKLRNSYKNIFNNIKYIPIYINPLKDNRFYLRYVNKNDNTLEVIYSLKENNITILTTIKTNNKENEYKEERINNITNYDEVNKRIYEFLN